MGKWLHINSQNFGKLIFFSFFLLIYCISFLLIITGKFFSPLFLLSIPLVLILLLNLDRNYLYYLIAALFLELYFEGTLKIQVINLVAYLIFLFYLWNKDSDLFSKSKLPTLLKFSSMAFITAVFLSAVNSPHFSILSMYFFYLFLTYIFTGYIVFKSVKNELSVEKFFNFYFICMAIICITIIFQIIVTSKIRSVSLTGYSIMDFSAITLTVLILKYFVMGKPNLKIIAITLLTLTILITTLSRFAWIAFVLSLLYGIIITYKYGMHRGKFIQRRFSIFTLAFVAFILIAFFLGIQNLILARFSDVSFEFFTPSDEGLLVQNSLESRMLIWITALNAFQANQLTGIGYLMFNFVSENYNVLPLVLYENYVESLDPHNTMLAFLTETGIIGFLSFLFFLFTVFIYSFKSIKISNDNERINSIVLNVIVFFLIINSTFSGQYTMAQQAFFMYIFFGLSIGNYVLLERKLLMKSEPEII